MRTDSGRPFKNGDCEWHIKNLPFGLLFRSLWCIFVGVVVPWLWVLVWR